MQRKYAKSVTEFGDELAQSDDEEMVEEDKLDLTAYPEDVRMICQEDVGFSFKHHLANTSIQRVLSQAQLSSLDRQMSEMLVFESELIA